MQEGGAATHLKVIPLMLTKQSITDDWQTRFKALCGEPGGPVRRSTLRWRSCGLPAGLCILFRLAVRAVLFTRLRCAFER